MKLTAVVNGKKITMPDAPKGSVVLGADGDQITFAFPMLGAWQFRFAFSRKFSTGRYDDCSSLTPSEITALYRAAKKKGRKP